MTENEEKIKEIKEKKKKIMDQVGFELTTLCMKDGLSNQYGHRANLPEPGENRPFIVCWLVGKVELSHSP